MIEELLSDPHGNIYYRMDNWHGFYAVIVNCSCCVPERPNGQIKGRALPVDAEIKMSSGSWM